MTGEKAWLDVREEWMATADLVYQGIFIVMSWEEHGLSATDSQLRMLNIFYNVIPDDDLIERIELRLVLGCYV